MKLDSIVCSYTQWKDVGLLTPQVFKQLSGEQTGMWSTPSSNLWLSIYPGCLIICLIIELFLRFLQASVLHRTNFLSLTTDVWRV